MLWRVLKGQVLGVGRWWVVQILVVAYELRACQLATWKKSWSLLLTYSGCTFYEEQTRQQEGQKQEQKQPTTRILISIFFHNKIITSQSRVLILSTDCDSLTDGHF